MNPVARTSQTERREPQEWVLPTRTERKKVAQNARAPRMAFSSLDHRDQSREWFARMLWRAFPSSSERQLAERAAKVLGCNWRTVINWLRCENDAGVRYVTAVCKMAGVDLQMDTTRSRK